MLPLRDRVSALLVELQHEKDIVARQGIPPNRAAAALQTTLDTTAALHDKKRERLASRYAAPEYDGGLEDTSVMDAEDDVLSSLRVFRDVCTHCKRSYWSTTAEERAAHPFKCAYRPVKCVGCGEGLRAKHAKEHVCRI